MQLINFTCILIWDLFSSSFVQVILIFVFLTFAGKMGGGGAGEHKRHVGAGPDDA